MWMMPIKAAPPVGQIFSASTGNSTINLDARICQHTKRDKALRNIDMVDKNYALKSNLLETQGQMAAIPAQNQMLQHCLATQDNLQILSFLDGTRLTIARHRNALAHSSQGGDIPRALPMEHASDKGKDEYKDDIRSAKQDDNYRASNIILPCPGS